ncbi:hypothetical protein E2562_034373 [Oryza meyeriana var. granulata]|uniref:Uncharacterized protein n=1 Tax=Oryza meyeriana var. granulata TaxID=110450 RepID=A0A6G1ESH0_9ORYZ|nr:hypothetical protein E2562_034373 [Oryza meyeriana var. granulata]
MPAGGSQLSYLSHRAPLVATPTVLGLAICPHTSRPPLLSLATLSTTTCCFDLEAPDLGRETPDLVVELRPGTSCLATEPWTRHALPHRRANSASAASYVLPLSSRQIWVAKPSYCPAAAILPCRAVTDDLFWRQ